MLQSLTKLVPQNDWYQSLYSVKLYSSVQKSHDKKNDQNLQIHESHQYKVVSTIAI